MEPKPNDSLETYRALRNLLLESSEEELREALGDKAFTELAARGHAVIQNALPSESSSPAVADLHRGLGALIRLLRRKTRQSVEEVASKARIDPQELCNIESDPSFDPNPRTIFQIEKHFKLPARSLVVLSGAVQVEDDVREESVRFAASADGITDLTRAEKKLLHRFVKFLREHTDE